MSNYYKVKLKESLPEFIVLDPTMLRVLNIQAEHLEQLLKELNSLDEQIDIEKATTMLEMWEKMLGIKTNTSLSLDTRRKNILSKLMFAETLNIKNFEKILSTYTKNINIQDKTDIPYTFLVSIDQQLTTTELREIERVIEEIKPAHLAYHLGYIKGLNNYFKFSTRIIDRDYFQCGMLRSGMVIL